jgi:hypothetical protein
VAAAPKPLQGSEAWRLRKPATGGQIVGFASRPSALPGTPVVLRVSTTQPRYRVLAYRLGRYVGGSGHRVWRSPELVGHHQAAARFAPRATRTVVAPWKPSVTVPTTGWEPGVYVFKLVASTGWEAMAPYVVSSHDARGKVALVAPVTTWQAYNDWGGYSLYDAPAGDRRSWAVSFERPYEPPGDGQLLYGVAPVVVAAERWGLPLAYYTNVDLDRRPDALQGATAYVSMGHDEYWTEAMRTRVWDARAAGTNLAFFGANTMYWRIRLADDGRLVVGYKYDAWRDPQLTRHPSQTTGRFRDGPVAQPENTLTGLDYECYPVDAPYTVAAPHWWGFSGTGVHLGDAFDHLVGIEADRVYPVPGSPRPMQVLSDVHYNCLGYPTSAQSVYYTSRSGAGVFDAGTLRWTCALTGRCSTYDLGERTSAFVRRVTHTLLTAFATGPAAPSHPAHDNVGRFDLSTSHQVPAS